MRAMIASASGLALALLALLAPPASAGDDEGLRHADRWGTSIAILGDPVPSIVSREASYDLTPYWRVHGGMGGGASPGFLEHIEWQTYGAGVRFFALPRKPISPVLGASMTYAQIQSQLLIFEDEPDEETAVTGAVSAGLDWQTKVGFNVAFGASVLLQAGESPFHSAPAFPFLRLGWLY